MDQESQLVLEEQEFLGWLAEPTTRAVLMALRCQREEIKELWACGNFTTSTCEGTALKNAEKIGEVNQLTDFIEIDYNAYLGMIGHEPTVKGGKGQGTRGVEQEREASSGSRGAAASI